MGGITDFAEARHAAHLLWVHFIWGHDALRTVWKTEGNVPCRIFAAVYQLPDGLYGVASGALRGLGMQPRLLWVNLGGFWGIGILLGFLLTFKAHIGIVGLWWGLLSGITSTGAAEEFCPHSSS